MSSFDELQTNKINEAMKVHADAIYKSHLKAMYVQPSIPMLDQLGGIDVTIYCPEGINWTVQEKFRDNSALQYKDFTQEVFNAYGTEHQANGEFFHLFAQLYFYGWSNQDMTAFDSWFIMDVARYKSIIWSYGGLRKMHKDGLIGFKVNDIHGKAAFYSIPTKLLEKAIMISKNVNGLSGWRMACMK